MTTNTWKKVTCNGKAAQNIAIDHPHYEHVKYSNINEFRLTYYSGDTNLKIEYVRLVRNKEVVAAVRILPARLLNSLNVDWLPVSKEKPKTKTKEAKP